MKVDSIGKVDGRVMEGVAGKNGREEATQF